MKRKSRKATTASDGSRDPPRKLDPLPPPSPLSGSSLRPLSPVCISLPSLVTGRQLVSGDGEEAATAAVAISFSTIVISFDAVVRPCPLELAGEIGTRWRSSMRNHHHEDDNDVIPSESRVVGCCSGYCSQTRRRRRSRVQAQASRIVFSVTGVASIASLRSHDHRRI
ncbi:hypothetical protein TIFTF001_008320 [Ficus carica]|uniref:Uncharacterized protein n=1 Tax=Ficus carica TaxID=3494 RepID=A0AA88D1M3_FICCA|nr:hypothetical protein TIFTF001_008320 [Ficus carica]